MRKIANMTYSLNQYDEDGNIFDKCILLFFGDFVMRFDDIEHLKCFRDEVEACAQEIEEGIAGSYDG